MSEAGGNVELSGDPISTEIGSGEVESSAIEDSGLAAEADGEQIDALADAVEGAIDEGASEAEIQELIETFNIKVNGEEREVTLDWNDKEDIVRRLQMAEAGQGAMQRSAEMELNFEKEIQGLIDDPWATLQELGFDPDALAEQRIQQRIQHLQKTPDQLAQEARDTELEELRQRLRNEEQQREEFEFAKLQQEAEIDLDNQITEALSATTELPKSPYVVKRVADAMLTAMENGRDDITAQDVIPWVEKEINGEIQDLFGAMPDKLLEKYIGNKTIDRLRQGRLSKRKAQPVGNIKQTGKQAPVTKKEKRNIKLGDWLKHGSSIKDFE